MDPWNRDILDKYCKNFNVGIIAFIPAEDKPYINTKFEDKNDKLKDLPTVNTRYGLKNLEIKSNASILRLTKHGVSESLQNSNSIWVTLTSKSENYETISLGHFNETIIEPTIVLDHGKYDKIPKILIGSGLAKHWLNRLLFLDALQYLSDGLINFKLNRYILIDIDDIFVGANRMTPNDVQALIESQEILSTLIPGFRYNLGFSGKTFKTGSNSELNEADELLIQNRYVSLKLVFFRVAGIL